MLYQILQKFDLWSSFAHWKCQQAILKHKITNKENRIRLAKKDLSSAKNELITAQKIKRSIKDFY